MVCLDKSLRAWNTPGFNDVLKTEIEGLDISQLPLQAGLAASSYVAESALKVMIIRASDDADHIYVKVGIFYAGIIAGSCCADDPTPVDENSEYCEIQLQVNKITAEAAIELVK